MAVGNTPDLVFDVAYASNWNSTAPTYTTVHNSATTVRRALEFGFNIGRQTELQPYSPGRLNITLRNDDDAFTESSTAYLGEFIGRKCRIKLVYGGSTYTAFTGFGDDDGMEPVRDGKDLDAVLAAVDGIDTLSRIDISSTFSSGVDSGTRVGAILDAAGWPDDATFRDIATGGSTSLAAVEYEDEQALSAIEHTMRSEQGRFFISADGKATMQARKSLQVPGDIALVFGDTPTAVDTPKFYGTGLDDFSVSGSFTGPPGSFYTVTVASTTLTFNYAIANTTIATTGLAMSTAGTTMAYGLTAVFPSTASYVTGDKWSFSAGEISFKLPRGLVGKRNTSNLYTKAIVSVIGATGDITSQSTAGIDSYLPRTITRNQTLLSTGEAQDLADYLVLKFGTPQRRFEQVIVSGVSSTDWWGPILGLGIGDAVKVKYRTPGGATLTQASFVEGISGGGGPGPGDWEWSFYVSPQDAQEYIILDDLVQGRIESTAASTGYALGY